jgi:hypothetical protein
VFLLIVDPPVTIPEGGLVLFMEVLALLLGPLEGFLVYVIILVDEIDYWCLEGFRYFLLTEMNVPELSNKARSGGD